MIIDCNAHLGHWPFRYLENSQPDNFVALMDRCGVTQACVAPFQGLLYGDVRPANDWLIEAIAPHSDRLMPHAAINPNSPDWQRDLEEAIAGGFVGLRLYPNYHGYELGDGCLADLMAAAQAHSLTVSIHARMYDERLHHARCLVPPVTVTEAGTIARRFPEVAIVLCNIKTAEINAIAEDLGSLPNLYVEISNLEGIGAVEKLVAEIGAGSIVFGTHAPYQYMEASLLKMRESVLAAEDSAAILYKNAQAWI